jgi:acetylornithine deacetylase/succinyl-diaminopimelate desuccinylase family protein
VKGERALDISRILKKIDRDELISFSQELIQTPSPSGVENAVGNLVHKKLKEIGLETEIFGGNVLGRLETNGSDRTLAFCGHLDTVEITQPQSWIRDPYSAEVNDGKLFGLGSADMKAGLAAQIMAIDAVKRAGARINGSLLFVATVLEEVGQEKVQRRKGIIELLDKGLVKADAVVIGEPTDLVVARGHKGLCNVILTSTGKAAHASVPESGVNAIEKMAKVVLALKTLKLGYHSGLGSGTITTCVMHGGSSLGIIPDTCRVSVDRRLTVGETQETVTAEIDRLLGDLKNEDHDLDVNAEYPYGYDAIITSVDHSIIKSIDLANRDVTNTHAKIGFVPFGTDGAWISKIANCPVIIYGPGRVTDAHKPNEYIELRQVTEASMVYAALLARYLS